MHYELIRKLLFLLEPERAHHFSLEVMKWAEKWHMSSIYRGGNVLASPVHLMGMTFPNPVGLAAGFDKNGDYIDALGDLGFGFIELGTVTPRPQAGNPRPRLFRLPEHEAIINRMGFNNKGVDYLIDRVRMRHYKGVIGINIGKNFDTPLELANRDYLVCFEKVYPHADYITINLSSPNTPGLRKLQSGEILKELVGELANKKAILATQYKKTVPMLIKIAPDLNDEDVKSIVETALACNVDGLIATNTTISRNLIRGSAHAMEAGGLSGKPLFETSTHILSALSRFSNGRLALMGVGGIDSASTAWKKFEAGASLIQLYTGFIYKGPALIMEICKELESRKSGSIIQNNK